MNIRIEQEFDNKAQHEAAQLLKASIERNQRKEMRLQLVERTREYTRRWLKSLFFSMKPHANTWIFFIGWATSMVIWVGLADLTLQWVLVAITRANLCYSLRFWG